MFNGTHFNAICIDLISNDSSMFKSLTGRVDDSHTQDSHSFG